MAPSCLKGLLASCKQEQRLKELSKRPSFATTDTSPVSTTAACISTAPAIDLFSTPSCSNGSANQITSLCDISGHAKHCILYYIYMKLCWINRLWIKTFLFGFLIFSALKMESDLFDMQTNFQSSMQPGPSVATAWGGETFCVGPSQRFSML